MKNMKETKDIYQTPHARVICLLSCDVITTSPGIDPYADDPSVGDEDWGIGG